MRKLAFPLLFNNCFYFSVSFFPQKYNREEHVKPKQSPLMTGFLFLFDGLKEHWLIGLSDATFNEQQGRTVGGKLAWCFFCRTELMKPRWIKLTCELYLCSGAVWMPHNYSSYSNICPGCKGSTVSSHNSAQPPLMRSSCTDKAHGILVKAQQRSLRFGCCSFNKT